jgi:hypothetical protein
MARFSLMSESEGTPGAPGVPGSNGAPGVPGTPGGDGAPGENGIPGSPGSNGSNGEPGQPGAPGSNGEPGENGIPGSPGSNGSNGEPGENGIPGQPGTPGSNGLNGAGYNFELPEGSSYSANLNFFSTNTEVTLFGTVGAYKSRDYVRWQSTTDPETFIIGQITSISPEISQITVRVDYISLGENTLIDSTINIATLSISAPAPA